MAQTRISFDAIRYAFDFANSGMPSEITAYLCRESGKTYIQNEFGDDIEEEPIPDDVDDSEKYLVIPDKHDFDLGKRLVMRFVHEHLPDDIDKVHEIFSRRGAYARFKDLLEHRDQLKHWYEYEEQATNEALREWCADNNLALEQGQEDAAQQPVP
ncbi:MAG: UPF0158 family protein [Rudaea sp.]